MLLSFLGAFACSSVLGSKEADSSDNLSVDGVYEESCGYSEGEVLCNISLEDQFKNTFNLNDHKGDVIVIDFSTMWCGYCQVSAPIGNDMYLEYKDSGFEWVTVLIEDSQGNIPNIYDQQTWSGIFELDYPVVAGSREEFINYNEEEGFAITSWPTFYILNKDLEISYIQKGWGESNIREVAKELLEE